MLPAGVLIVVNAVWSPVLAPESVVTPSFVLIVASVSSPVFVPLFVPVMSLIIATVPSLSGSVHVLSTVAAVVNQLVIVLAALRKFNLNSVSPGTPPDASFDEVRIRRLSAAACAVETGLLASLVLSTLPRPMFVLAVAVLSNPSRLPSFVKLFPAANAV